MEDRNSKKSFVIPKTHQSNKDVLILEKTDSRNVMDLFDDIKSCSLETQFDFRQDECKSCETIRNQKLQKLYNKRRLQMKKDQDLTERLAFHLIKSRALALDIANDGLNCEQLSFPIDQYLGNPQEGIHLSRRPDVLLASSGAQGLFKFGLLICKILLGKGYATIPSIANKQLSAQLHYDHHFCKIRSLNKEQRPINDLLADSLIFCYEHDDVQTVSHPSQILPLAILWYDVKERFSFKSKSKSEESHKRNEQLIMSKALSNERSLVKATLTSTSSLKTDTRSSLTENKTMTTTTGQITSTEYPSHLMLPSSSLYTSFTNVKPSRNNHDSRLVKTSNIPSQVIPLSPQNARPQSDTIASLQSAIHEQEFSLINIPLNSTVQLIDPRLTNIKSRQNIFYLESKAVKRALEQQKRLNNYYNSQCDSKPKTSYTLIPFFIRSIPFDEYKQHDQIVKNSSDFHCPSLSISVIDCFDFGITTTNKRSYVDLKRKKNKLAYEQINISNQLIQHEKKLSSREIRLQLREKRQRKIEENMNKRKEKHLSYSNVCIHTGRKLLKEHQLVTSSLSSNRQISTELLDFLSNEYQYESRPYVKSLLAELVGIFVEKYGLQHKQDDIQLKEIVGKT